MGRGSAQESRSTSRRGNDSVLRIMSGKNRSALYWAEKAHRGQERSDDVPYVLHPVAVATALAGAGCDRDVVCAGCLHDIVEDTDVTLEEVRGEFGNRVADLVKSVTKGKDFKGMPLEEQAQAVVKKLDQVGQDSYAVKAADLLANMTDSVHGVEQEGDTYWVERFKGETRARRKTRHYVELSRLLQERLTQYPLLREALKERTREFTDLMEKAGWLS